MIMDNRFLVARRRYDPDATRYINAVQLADGQALEPEVAMAVDAFVKGCKSDGIWSALKASCIMCGARTISGALVPLVGTAPTPYNFASGDYSRTTGLKGDGATKYLDSNRANNADGQDDNHISVYASSLGGTQMAIAGVSNRSPFSYRLLWHALGNEVHGWTNTLNTDVVASAVVSGATFAGTSRGSGALQSLRAGGIGYSVSATSVTPATSPVLIFARSDTDGTPDFTDARLAFYSIGSALDLAALDNRVTTLVAAIAAAL